MRLLFPTWWTVFTAATLTPLSAAWMQHQYHPTGPTHRPVEASPLMDRHRIQRRHCRSIDVPVTVAAHKRLGSIRKRPGDVRSLHSQTFDTESTTGIGGSRAPPQLSMYNSKTRQKEVFVPQPHLSDVATTATATATSARGPIVTFYTCGPTVYDFAHIGNFRAFLTYDVLKRALTYLGYTVIHVCNITDIDDKIIVRANQQKLAIGTIATLTRHYETCFRNDLTALNCLPATVYPRATEHVPAMIRMVQTLALKDLAYETPDGSWYFDTQNTLLNGSYGKQLVQLDFNDMQQQKELVENMSGKRHFADFCLWKAFKDPTSLATSPEDQDSFDSTPSNGDREDAAWSSDLYTTLTVSDTTQDDAVQTGILDDTTAPEDWTSPARMDKLRRHQLQPLAEPRIQKGRPGWHLECSAMAQTYFGQSRPLDFHGGGIDLKFPHHENEIAQSEGVTLAQTENNHERMPFCNCWFHNGFVNIGTKNEKMSKSLGNFITLADACPTRLDVRAYRYLIVSSQYRNPLSFTDSIMEASKNAIVRMDKVKAAIEQALKGATIPDGTVSSELTLVTVPNALTSFEAALADDLSMPRAAAALFTLIKAAEQELKQPNVDAAGLQTLWDAVMRMDSVFGIFGSADDTSGEASRGVKVTVELPPTAVLDLVEQRAAAKNAKDWVMADSLRQQITDLGWSVKDVKGGDPMLSKLPG